MPEHNEPVSNVVKSWCAEELNDLTTLKQASEEKTYTLFQNGRNFSFLLFPCKLALVASFKVKYSSEFCV